MFDLQNVRAEPIPLPTGGSISEPQAKLIMAKTNVKASTRDPRPSRKFSLPDGAKELTLHGDADGIKEATSMALHFIALNGKDGVRKSPAEQEQLRQVAKDEKD